MTYTLIVDEQAPGSLEMIQRLTNVANVSNQGDGVYQVSGSENVLRDVLDAYPQAVMKLETT